jgi:hypothetical protein
MSPYGSRPTRQPFARVLVQAGHRRAALHPAVCAPAQPALPDDDAPTDRLISTGYPLTPSCTIHWHEAAHPLTFWLRSTWEAGAVGALLRPLSVMVMVLTEGHLEGYGDLARARRRSGSDRGHRR